MSAVDANLTHMSHIEELLNESHDSGACVAWATGIEALDRLTGGLHPGEVWLVTGTPG